MQHMVESKKRQVKVGGTSNMILWMKYFNRLRYTNDTHLRHYPFLLKVNPQKIEPTE